MNPTTTTPAVLSPAHVANRRLARSINLALDLGAPEERIWTVPITAEHLERCAQAGFIAIRLICALSLHPDRRGTRRIDERVIDRINAIAGDAADLGLTIVVANMLDLGLMADPPTHRERLLEATHELAASLSGHGPHLLIEPLAEPTDALDGEWNAYLEDLRRTVRNADPARTIVAGPRSHNNARFLNDLVIAPDENNLILTIHQYWPIMFTMQGEAWLGATPLGRPELWVGTAWEGDARERAELEQGFAAVAHHAHTQNRPVFVGEFGTSDNADMASRIRWTRFNRELAEAHDFSLGYFSYGPTFSLWEDTADRWHRELLRALIPQTPLNAGR